MNSASIVRLRHALRKASEAERAWFTAITGFTAPGPVALADLWSAAWFFQGSGRALIVQPDQASAYVYVSSQAAKNASDEVAQTLAVAMLLELVIDTGLALVQRSPLSPPGELRYVGAMFDGPRLAVLGGKPRIILNPTGDYTEDPTAILDSKGEELYAGVQLARDAYQLMLTATHGMLLVRPGDRAALLNLLPRPKPAAVASPATATVKGGGEGEGEQSALAATTGPQTANAGPPKGDVAGGPVANTSHPGSANGWHPRLVLPLVLTAMLLATGSAALGFWGKTVLELSHGSARPEPGPHESLPGPERDAVTRPLAPALPTPGESNPGLRQLVGLDVSRWSGGGRAGAEAVFAAVGKIDFAFARVAYGARPDPEFPTNWRLMESEGLYRGAYLLLRLDEDVVTQVAVAVDQLGRAKARDLCLTVDFEEMSMPAHGPIQDTELVQHLLSVALRYTEVTLGCTPILYTSPSMKRYLNLPGLERYPLWIADWTLAKAPQIPAPWNSFTFWQRSNDVRRSPAPADFDIFNGTLEDLTKLSRPAEGS